jgi:hypothetical protein
MREQQAVSLGATIGRWVSFGIRDTPTRSSLSD